MSRDVLRDERAFDEAVRYEIDRISTFIHQLDEPVLNSSYQPQFLREIVNKYLALVLRRYSRGDPVSDLSQYFDPLLHYWEESERLGHEVWTAEQQRIRHTWSINLDFYIDCFWLVGLGLALEIPDDQWRRLIALVGNDGEDALLDRIIATRTPGRKIGSQLCYRKPYTRLMKAIDAPIAEQPGLLNEFVERWYSEIASAAKSGRDKQAVPFKEPYWHGYHHPMKGAYFGYWCLEAVAAVKAFGLDDGPCMGNPHYPGDLLRPGVVTPPDPSRLEPSLTATLANPSASNPLEEPRQLSGWQALKLVIKNKLSR